MWVIKVGSQVWRRFDEGEVVQLMQEMRQWGKSYTVEYQVEPTTTKSE